MKKENTYIMNIDGAYIVKEMLNEEEALRGILTVSGGGRFKTKGRDLRKLFSATMPYSLESMRIDSLCTENNIDEAFYQVNGKQYTKVIVNVTFDSDWFKLIDKDDVDKNTGELVIKKCRKKIMTKKAIRKYLNEHGFKIDGKEYVFYKRGAGKAKNGYAFFVRKEIRDRLILRSRLGIHFEKNEELDLTSLLAYESLISSGIVSTIDINPLKEIFIMDDLDGIPFKSVASVTRESGGELRTQNEEIELKNCITDGQGLLDESVFEKYNVANKGFMLLRNDMFKSCAFNTKLQAWFNENGVTELTDMFGRVYDAKDIKLVITPNSLKFLKFAYKFESEKDCYEHWLNTIDTTFGVVKYDKEGNYGNYNRTTYQLLNSIPTLTRDELEEIAQEEKAFVMMLKNDNAVFRNYIGQDAIASLKLEKALEDDSDDLTMLETTELYSALLLVNSNVIYSKEFKQIRSALIKNYVTHLKHGKVRLKDAKYCTLFSNPYEMLLGVIGKYENKSIMTKREVYCPYYTDGEEFCVSRNPHIDAGNVMYAKNIYHDEYRWFNLTDNVVAINFFDVDTPDRLQGCDTDSDTAIFIPNRILVEKAKYCEEYFATPLNRVKGSSLPRKYNANEITKLDIVLSNNYIGKIVNMSQILNSYMNDMIMSGSEDKEMIDTLYQATSRLSSMSQIEIDKSKKVFDNVSMSKELKKMRDLPCIRKVECYNVDKGIKYKKMIVPKFFEFVAPSEYKINEQFNTPLDLLQSVFRFRGANRQFNDKNIDLISLLIKQKDCDGVKPKENSINAVFKVISEGGNKLIGLRNKSCKLNDKAKQTVIIQIKKDMITKLKTLNPSQATIHRIIKLALSTNNKDVPPFSKYKSLTLNCLFNAYRKKFLGCFKSFDMGEDEVLIKVDEIGEITIFGECFNRVKRKELVRNP